MQYRMENYSECIAVYSRLFQEHPSVENAAEVRTNVIAAYAIGGRAADISSTLSTLQMTSQDTFEVSFNVACGLVEERKIAEAEEALHLARRVGEEQLYEEELEEKEVEAELAPVNGQLAFLAALQKKFDEAVPALREVLGSGDQMVGVAAAVDLASVLLRHRPGDRKAAGEALKALEPFVERNAGYLRVTASLSPRLGSAQCEAVLTSYASAAMVAGKVDIAREAVRSMEKAYKGSSSVLLLQAALWVRDGKTKEAAALLEDSSSNSSSSTNLLIQLTRAQLAVSSGSSAGAASILASLPAAATAAAASAGGDNQQSWPAVLATRAALLEQVGDVEGAAAVMQAALQQSAPHNGDDVLASRWALRRLAGLDMKRGDLEAATASLHRLVAADEAALEDPELLSMLTRLVACCDVDNAVALSAKLPVPPSLSAAEVDALETAGVQYAGSGGGGTRAAVQQRTATTTTKTTTTTTADGVEVEKKKKNRKRKILYPKGFDPANPGPMPDPERWLPKWQRADSKKMRKKRKDKDMVKGSQGAGSVDASLDRTGSAAAVVEKASTAPAKSGGGKKKKGRR